MVELVERCQFARRTVVLQEGFYQISSQKNSLDEVHVITKQFKERN